jgi:hypothetical protein
LNKIEGEQTSCEEKCENILHPELVSFNENELPKRNTAGFTLHVDEF